ncbi:MAG: hypothetical protein ACK4E7_02750 [Permianibacter sp.]
MKLISVLLSALLTLSMSGCATIFESSSQTIRTITTDNQNPRDTRCTLTNEEGEWTVIADTSAMIHRDGNPMKVKCDNQQQIGEATVNPSFMPGYLLLDIVWDACILTASCIIDGATNAFYEYPEQIVIPMRPKSQ